MCTGGAWGASNGQGESGWGDEQSGQGWGAEHASHSAAERGTTPHQASSLLLSSSC